MKLTKTIIIENMAMNHKYFDTISWRQCRDRSKYVTMMVYQLVPIHALVVVQSQQPLIMKMQRQSFGIYVSKTKYSSGLYKIVVMELSMLLLSKNVITRRRLILTPIIHIPTQQMFNRLLQFKMELLSRYHQKSSGTQTLQATKLVVLFVFLNQHRYVVMVYRAMVQAALTSKTVGHQDMRSAMMEIVLIMMDARVVQLILGMSVQLGVNLATSSVVTDTLKLRIHHLLVLCYPLRLEQM